MSDDDSTPAQRSVVSRKELARQLRHQAYVRAKEQRAKDPKYLAMKEAVKQGRREAYQRVKAQRKAAQAEAKTRDKQKREEQRAEERAALNGELMKLVTRGTKDPYSQN
jgi:hypothetical protein